jgi:aldehyde:ferredoxin oxidoreductase
VITGKAKRPSYLVITEEGCEVKPADKIWGKNTYEATRLIHHAEGREMDVMAIGPAGENLVPFSCISHYWLNRHGFAGRGGLGAVMGSKNLKAIGVKGTRKTQVADLDKLKKLVDSRKDLLLTGTAGLKRFGTPGLVNLINEMGGLGTRNVQTEVCDKAEAISGERMKDLFFKKDSTCFHCYLVCGKCFYIRDGKYAGTEWRMPEYETIYALGTMLENYDPSAIIKANKLCDEMGLDTITMGVTLAFACECFEKGIITTKETRGRKLSFGDPDLIMDMIMETAYRKGFGDFLAKGSNRMAEELGGEAKKYLYTVKGLEIPGHSARILKGMSIGYATGTRGGSHHDARPTLQYSSEVDNTHIDGQPEFAVRTQNFTAVGDSLTQCRFAGERGFGGMLNENYTTMINAITGLDLSVDDIETIGERICTLERSYNCREGIRRKDDILPYRVMNEPVPSGAHKGMHCPRKELDLMLDEYYQLRGWDKDGVPTKKRLKELGLEFVIPDLFR